MRTERRKARKEHRCTLCGEPIVSGTDYVYDRITPWDHEENDTFMNYRAHPLCHDLWIDIGDGWDWEFPSEDEFKRELADAPR